MYGSVTCFYSTGVLDFVCLLLAILYCWGKKSSAPFTIYQCTIEILNNGFRDIERVMLLIPGVGDTWLTLGIGDVLRKWLPFPPGTQHLVGL